MTAPAGDAPAGSRPDAHAPTGGAPAGIVLAAGAGTRFGGPKALATLDGEQLVTRAVGVLRAAGCRPVVVVLGARAGEVQERADLAGAEVVVNARWEEGMSTSLRVGLEAARGRAGAAVLALADQPLVTAAAVQRVIAAWRAGAVAVVATYAARARNPALLDAGVWDDVLAEVHGDEGARVWLRAHPEHVTEVECGDVASADDVDVPADLERLRGGGS